MYMCISFLYVYTYIYKVSDKRNCTNICTLINKKISIYYQIFSGTLLSVKN